MESTTDTTDTITRLRRRIAELSPHPVAPPGLHPPTTLPVPDPIAPLIPHRGLSRGTVVQLSGATTLLAGLIAAVTGAGTWAALIDVPRFGLLAAAEMGADLTRCALISDPRPDPDPVAVAAVLVDGIDLVALALAGADIPPSRARAVTVRVRRTGAVLLVTDGHWPTVDLHLAAHLTGYRGLDGTGSRVTGLTLTVEARARGRRPHRTDIVVAGRADRITWTAVDDEATPLAAAR